MIIYLGLQNQIFCLGSQTKDGFGWFFKEAPNQHDRSLFFILFFWEMGLSCFPNHQSEIMIDADLVTLLYNLELGFPFFFPDKPNKGGLLSLHCP